MTDLRRLQNAMNNRDMREIADTLGIYRGDSINGLIDLVERHSPLKCERFSPVRGSLAAENSASSAGSLQKGRGLPEISQRASCLNPSHAGLGRDDAALPRKQSLPSISLGRCDYSDGYAQCSQKATIVLVDPDNDWHEFEFCVDHYQGLVKAMRKQAQ